MLITPNDDGPAVSAPSPQRLRLQKLARQASLDPDHEDLLVYVFSEPFSGRPEITRMTQVLARALEDYVHWDNVNRTYMRPMKRQCDNELTELQAALCKDVEAHVIAAWDAVVVHMATLSILTR